MSSPKPQATVSPSDEKDTVEPVALYHPVNSVSAQISPSREPEPDLPQPERSSHAD